jgi:methionyl-tRNA synthetase
MRKEKFYVTTAIDYINDVIHIGHSYQKLIADILYRYHKSGDKDAYFLTGTDNHGGKAEEGAKEAKIPIEEFSQKISAEDEDQLASLEILPNRFIQTTDPDHKETVYQIYQKIRAAGDIYKGEYEGIYCSGCEEFKVKRDLTDGRCPQHPTACLETLTEENYFFKLSKYQDFLIKHIEKNPQFVKPKGRRKEILAFLKNEPLKDTPISRPKVKWGIPFPDDPTHTIYVWFEAVMNYVSGAPQKYWPADLHIIGKDNLRFHAVLWPAILKSAKMPLPRTVYAHGFLSIEGKKISKSLGNIIRPKELVEEFGVDPVRYYLARYGPAVKDADISKKRIKEVYNSDLADGLGNLLGRVTTLVERGFAGRVPTIETPPEKLPLQKGAEVSAWKKYKEGLERLRVDSALTATWEFISACDKHIDEKEPWKSPQPEVLYDLLEALHQIAWMIYPFMPKTASAIGHRIGIKALTAKSPQSKNAWIPIKPKTKVVSKTPLFPRLK